MKKKLILFLVLTIFLSLTGCSNSGFGGLGNTQGKDKTDSKEAAVEVKGDKYPLTIVDYFKNEVVLKEQPKKVAVLSGSHINIWYDLGGKSICTSNISSNLKILSGCEEQVKALPTVGEVYQLNMEAVTNLKPDLIIVQAGVQTTAAKDLAAMGFPVISLHLSTYDNLIDTYRAFGKILNKSELAEEKIAKLQSEKEVLIEKMPEEGKSAVILYLTSQSLSAKLDNSIAGDVAKILGIRNIAADLPADTIGSENTPLDIEYIVEKNPDCVLVTSMISNNEAAIATMEKQFKENPAWKGVKAVQENKVVYLPQEYFLYNAGPYYNQAVEYMARGVYPEIYGEIEGWYEK